MLYYPMGHLPKGAIYYMKRFLYRILCGFLLGISVFAPGFSGSVMAITMGIYQDLVRIMSNPAKELKRNIGFFIPILIGVAISLVLFVQIFDLLFDSYIRATLLLFAGFIAGNLPVITREVRKCSFQMRYLLGGALSFAIALGLIVAGLLLDRAAGNAASGVPFFELAIAGFIAGSITLVPGMSISTVLIMLGVYTHLMDMAASLMRFDLAYLLPLLGVVVFAFAGLVLTSRGIKRVFERFPGFANACVLGFMSGTLIGIIVKSLHAYDPNFTWPIGVITLVAGLIISLLFVRLGQTMNKKG